MNSMGVFGVLGALNMEFMKFTIYPQISVLVDPDILTKAEAF